LIEREVVMLVKCWECGARISDEARRCPKCGKQDPQPPYRSTENGCLGEIIGIIFWWIVVPFIVLSLLIILSGEALW